MKTNLRETAEIYGYDSVDDMIENYMWGSVVPACCTEECEVEPDGTCSHGNPSILIECGVI